MPMCHAHVQWLAVFMLVAVFRTGLCDQDRSRRVVAEHQLMHDRGRNIQTLKRLIWLSGATEGLHTARTRSAASGPGPRKAPAPEPNRNAAPDLAVAVDDYRPVLARDLLRNFFNSLFVTHVAEREP
ncbi:parathyroid hormone 4 [Phyllopteryx taeniolatus]|uniref:parathyroid hormone 4 n=1 Tax=Phyllopteryx taeniolatus TaxID=161469 RepID=UPI002AD3CD86|nr:parathyroid hormone 4 [Phyllopteryx taeniolatus]XP_061641829.1 parathyroid hormone 4 [Phyllopteryx taeniolatus]